MRNVFIPTLLAITFIALALRLAVGAQLADTQEVKTPNPQTDMATYLRLADEIRQGTFPDHYDYQPLYYTAVLPWLQTTTHSPWPRILLQALLGSAAVFLTGLTAALLFGRRSAWLAALLLALSRFHIFYTPFALYEVLQSFWLALLLFLAVLAFRHNRTRDWILLGCVLSLSILTRGNTLLYLPLMLLLIWLRNRHALRKTAALACGILLLTFIPQLPFSLKNLTYAGHWTGPSTAGPKVLALGNSPEAPAAGLAYPSTYHQWVRESDEQTRSMASNIIGWALQQPLPFLELKMRTFLHFWDSEEVPNNVNIEAHGYPYSPILRFPCLVSFGLISCLALAGFLLNLRNRHGAIRLLFAYVLVFCAATVMFYMLARFRIAILPALCVLAAGTAFHLQKLHRRWKTLTPEHQRRQTLCTLLAFLAAGYLSYAALPHYQYLYEADVHRLIQPEGTVAVFPHAVLIHDHGPLPMGAGLRSLLPAAGLTLHKQFAIPEHLRQRCQGKPFIVRLMMANSTPQSNFTPDNVTVAHGRHSARPGHPVVRHTFSSFIEAEFPALELAPDGTATVTFAFPTAPQPYPAVVLDNLRDYRRTQFSGPDAETLKDLPAEPFAELEIDLAHP